MHGGLSPDLDSIQQVARDNICVYQQSRYHKYKQMSPYEAEQPYPLWGAAPLKKLIDICGNYEGISTKFSVTRVISFG